MVQGFFRPGRIPKRGGQPIAWSVEGEPTRRWAAVVGGLEGAAVPYEHLDDCRYCQGVVAEHSEIGRINQELPPHVSDPQIRSRPARTQPTLCGRRRFGAHRCTNFAWSGNRPAAAQRSFPTRAHLARPDRCLVAPAPQRTASAPRPEPTVPGANRRTVPPYGPARCQQTASAARQTDETQLA
jgi:hypothetical protein